MTPSRAALACASRARTAASSFPRSVWCPAFPVVIETKRTVQLDRTSRVVMEYVEMSQSSGCAPIIMARSGEAFVIKGTCLLKSGICPPVL